MDFINLIFSIYRCNKLVEYKYFIYNLIIKKNKMYNLDIRGACFSTIGFLESKIIHILDYFY